MTAPFKVTVEGGTDQYREEVRSILQRVADDFLAPSVTMKGFEGFGLHIRGCSCGNCDGSGGIPGGLVIAFVYRSTPSIPPRRRKVEFREIQVGDRLLLDLRDDPVAKTLGLGKKEAWGKAIDCHTPDGWHVVLEASIGSDHGPMGLVYRLNPDNVYRVMDLQRGQG